MSDFPTSGRLLGVDPGHVRIGLAVCDVEQKIASPLETYRRRDEAQNAAFFRNLIIEENIVGFVVGLAISLNGTEGPKANEARDLAKWLTHITGLPAAFQDERYTTHYANDLLESMGVKPQHRKGKLDALAAQVILQIWIETAALDRTRGGE